MSTLLNLWREVCERSPALVNPQGKHLIVSESDCALLGCEIERACLPPAHPSIVETLATGGAVMMGFDDETQQVTMKAISLEEMRTPTPAAQSAGQDAAGWRSVDDGLPEPETDVLVRKEFGAAIYHDIAGLFDGVWKSQVSQDDCKFHVTHWMPLPSLYAAPVNGGERELLNKIREQADKIAELNAFFDTGVPENWRAENSPLVDRELLEAVRELVDAVAPYAYPTPDKTHTVWAKLERVRAALSSPAKVGVDERDAAWEKWILDPKFYDWNTTAQCAQLHFTAGFDAARAALSADGGELIVAANIAVHEMRHTSAPRNSFTEAVDRLDAAVAASTAKGA
ncbi:hypothetical protein PCA31118_05231 [Pandoraea captiosa]|uniref:DUF551 domain-containing protein n=1 Tax=Pandoraea captiosa TaxID=2508302 RepID=A0A5E5AUI5_9BURK|nr:DUF551 domain-containing protein [Pandoraea captiosa]VVE76532.1 hypothetical protein PCA31118_05231 [Pandoraea captiosa]